MLIGDLLIQKYGNNENAKSVLHLAFFVNIFEHLLSD